MIHRRIRKLAFFMLANTTIGTTIEFSIDRHYLIAILMLTSNLLVACVFMAAFQSHD